MFNYTLPFCPLYIRDTGLIWKYTHGIITFEYVAYFLITPIQSVLGILGNSIAFFVAINLADHVTSHYLSHLAVFNAIVCALALIYPFTEQYGMVRRLSFVQSCSWVIMVRKVVLIISFVFKKASILIITIFFLDRYLVVSKPTQLSTWRQSRIHAYIPMIVIVIAFVFTVPTVRWYTINRCMVVTPLPTNYTSPYEHQLFITDFIETKDPSFGRKWYDFIRKSEISDALKVWCFKEITGRGRWFLIYEVFREMVLTLIPSLAMMYFVIVIAYTILVLKKKSRKSAGITTDTLQQFGNRCTEPGTTETGLNPLNNVLGKGSNLEHEGINDKTQTPGHVPPKPKPSIVKRNFNVVKVNSGWRIVSTLCGFVMLYCLSTLPASIMSLLYSISYSVEDTPSLDNLREQWSHMIVLSIILDLANYCWCFYLYTLLDTTFRQRLIEMFHPSSQRRVHAVH